MSRLTMSDEMSILNELTYMEEKLYKGQTSDKDVKYAIKTIKNLLLEIYLIKQSLDPEELVEVEMHIKNAKLAAEASLQAYEANKAF